MTREEAIKILEEYPCSTGEVGGATCAVVFDAGLDETEAALDMAIAALREQESTENAHCNCCKNGNSWISVEERLPEHKTEVLCFSKNAGVFVGTDWVDWPDGKIMFHLGTSYDWPYATHWMPLPSQPEVEV